MTNANWNADMSFGLCELDSSHKDILNGFDQLKQVMDEEFCLGYTALVARIEVDFFKEEEMMEQRSPTDLKSHREQHARILGILHHVAARIMKGDLIYGRKIASILPDCFIQHIMTCDAGLAMRLRRPNHARSLQYSH